MGAFAKGKRPRQATIQEAIEYFGSLGLSVYGGYVDLRDGEEKPGCKDYSAAEIVRLRELVENDEIWRAE